MIAVEFCGGKDFYVGVDMHIILLRFHGKCLQAFGNRILFIPYIYGIIDNAPRVGYPLTPYHKLIFRVISERITQSAMPAGNSHTAFNSIQQSFFLFLTDLAHGPYLHNQVETAHQNAVCVAVKIIINNYFSTL